MTSVTAPRRTTTAQLVDPYAHSAELDDEAAELLATQLEVRGGEPRQRVLGGSHRSAPAPPHQEKLPCPTPPPRP